MTGYSTGTDNELTYDGTWNYTYDAVGNMTTKVNIADGTTWVYQYDDSNHMTVAQLWSASPIVYGTGGAVMQMEADYKYDAFGNRIEKDVWSASTGTVATRYALDGFNSDKPTPVGNENWDVWAVMDGNNNLITRYVNGDSDNQVFARTDSNGAAWLLTDQLGSTTDVIDNSGALLDQIDYDAFGNIISNPNPAAGGGILYTGDNYDAETGLYFSRARYLDPLSGRWTTQDPMGFAAGDSNLYRYVGNAPAEGTDPSGDYLFVNINALQGVQDYFTLYGVNMTPVNIGQGWYMIQPNGPKPSNSPNFMFGDAWSWTQNSFYGYTTGQTTPWFYGTSNWPAPPTLSNSQLITIFYSDLANYGAQATNSIGYQAFLNQSWQTAGQQAVIAQMILQHPQDGPRLLALLQSADGEIVPGNFWYSSYSYSNGTIQLSASSGVLGSPATVAQAANWLYNALTANRAALEARAQSAQIDRNALINLAPPGMYGNSGNGSLSQNAQAAGGQIYLFALGYILLLSSVGSMVGPSGAAGGIVASGRPLGLGSTGRNVAGNLREQLAMEQAISNPVAGRILQGVPMTDPRWPAAQGWVKMAQNINGIEIHYVCNTITGAIDDFKFILPLVGSI